MINDAAMAEPVTTTGTIKQIGRIAHAFHAAGDSNVRAAGRNQVMCQHHRLHAGAAHLVDGACARRVGQARADRCLPRRRLPLPGRQDAAENHFLDRLGRNLAALQGGADSGCAELRSGRILQVALKSAHCGAGGTDDDDRIKHCHFNLPGGPPQRGPMRKAPSRRMTSPFSIVFSQIWRTSAANSDGSAKARRKGHALAERFLNLRRHARHHRRFEDAWRNRNDADAVAGEFPGDRQGHPDDAAFRCRVGGLTDLSVEGGNRGRVDDDAALAFAVRFLVLDDRGGKTDHVEGADEVDADRAGEIFEAMRAVAPKHLFARRDPCAVYQTMQMTEALKRCVDRGKAILFAGHVRAHETGRRFTQFGADPLTGLRIDVGNNDARTGLDQQAGDSRAQARAATRNQKYLARDQHDVPLPLRTGAVADF